MSPKTKENLKFAAFWLYVAIATALVTYFSPTM